ncbi:MAG: hypothetical protein M1828_005701 [Chrysothrix sp. TS-e1954]|nr:MAG: hypothetical protein M1828_005701 [Chrysothrix sp. TS-e1954]
MAETTTSNGDGLPARPGKTTPPSAAKKLRDMLADRSKTIVAPGVFDGLTARLALSTGFDCLYMTGAGTSMSRLGWADLGMATFNDMSDNADMIANLDPSVPLIADADTGYGGPLMVHRTTKAYARSGVAGLHIEDQIQEKRCGQLMGKQLVDLSTWQQRLRAAVQARDEIGSDLVIIARTDARGPNGFDAAVERLASLGREDDLRLGVDAYFLEGLQSKEEARKACESLGDVERGGKPMLLNMVPSGVTPNMGVQEAKEMGFRLVIFPSVCIEGVMRGCQETLQGLKQNGVQELPKSLGPREAFMVCGLKDGMKIDKLAGGATLGTI